VPAELLFIADLHLDPARPEALACCERFLRGPARDAAGLYILGDLFEAWIGDDDPAPAFEGLFAALRALAEQGVPVRVLHGNRDFLLGTGFEARTGARILPDPWVGELAGRRVLLTHGDALCTGDREYQAFRAQVRDPGYRRAFLARTLAERRRIAAALRAESRRRTAGKPESIMDVDPGEVAAWMRRHGVRLMVHGHTHRPAIHRFELDGAEAVRAVVGDWYEQGSVLHLAPDGTLRLETLPFGAPAARPARDRAQPSCAGPAISETVKRR